MGTTQEMEVDLQLVAATNMNLEEAIQRDKFRKDLYYRLKTIEIFLPSLRERVNDIPQLVNHFLNLFREQGRTKISKIANSAWNLLRQYNWPGNIRELKSCIERAIIYAEHNHHSQVEPEDLPYEVRANEYESRDNIEIDIPEKGINIDEKLASLELAFIEKALKTSGGKKTQAWKLLGYNDRFALRRRIEIILKKFPNLIKNFPYLKKKY